MLKTLTCLTAWARAKLVVKSTWVISSATLQLNSFRLETGLTTLKKLTTFLLEVLTSTGQKVIITLLQGWPQARCVTRDTKTIVETKESKLVNPATQHKAASNRTENLKATLVQATNEVSTATAMDRETALCTEPLVKRRYTDNVNNIESHL